MSFFLKLFQRITSYFKKKKRLEANISSEVTPKETKLKRFVNDDIIVRRIEGINFIFDKESFKEFESFIDDNHILIVENGYLARRQKRKNGFVTFFHRWLMFSEIDKFGETHGGQVEVDHLLGKNDNRKSSLSIKSEFEHKIKHGREKEYWDKIEKKRKELLQNKKNQTR